jgi:hypothetical protein
MPTPHVLILRSPGANCDGETQFAFMGVDGGQRVIHEAAAGQSRSRMIFG